MKTYKHVIFRRKNKRTWNAARRRRDRSGRGWSWCHICIEAHDATAKAWLSWSFVGLSAAEHRDIADFLDQLNKEGKPK